MSNYPDILLRLENMPILVGSIERIYGLMLYGAMKHQRPGSIVELGTGQGYSTAWMLLGLEENEYGHIWSCDIVPADSPIWSQIGLKADRLTYFSNDPVETLANKFPPMIDFIFCDAPVDYSWLLPRLSLHGSIVIHGKLREFDENEWKYEQISEGCGVTIATRIKLPEDVTCKDESSGSTMQRGMDLLQEKTGKITSRISQRSKAKKVTRRSKKINSFNSMRNKNKKGQERKRLQPEMVKA
jgi:hypothetical protein